MNKDITYEQLQVDFEQCLKYAVRAYEAVLRPKPETTLPYDQTAVALIAFGMFVAKHG